MRISHIFKISQPAKKTRSMTLPRMRSARNRRHGKLIIHVLLTFVFLLTTLLAPFGHRLSPSGRVSADTESISTTAADFSTPKAAWNLGETANAVAMGAPQDRRIAWVAPDGTIAQVSNYFSGTLNDSYSIPTGSDPLAQVGTWTVATISPSGTVFTAANFVVRDPNQASADLSLGVFGPFEVTSGNNINYRVELTNLGPDDAQNVVLSNPVPGDTTFSSEAQTSGPVFTCTTPSSGSSTGTISCTIASLPAGATAVFSVSFTVTGAAGGNITDAASVTSDTNDLRQADNTASSSTSILATSSGCAINCPGNINQDNDPNQCGAAVSYSVSGSCGDITCNPPSGAFFPIGNTAVICAAQSGDSCSFTVHIQDTRTPVPPTITCPANVSTSEEFPGAGEATVNYSLPTTTGNCVNVICTPPSGSPFRTGVTTVNCTGTDSANNSVSCSFSVTVSGTGACSLVCPGDVTVTAPAGQCNAVATYSSPTTSGNCGTVTCSPASGSTFAVGATVVTCVGSEGGSCDFTVTVNPASPPTITTCPANRTVAANASCEGVIPNLVNEVVTTGCGVTISQSPTAGSIVGVGPVTVTITAENGAGQTTCTTMVTVAETTPPVITNCPAASSAAADANCQAPVPNVLGSVTATDNCTPPELLTITQSPAAGTLVSRATPRLARRRSRSTT
jgi:uncharacterized repeat protein (TIGR01451 family)